MGEGMDRRRFFGFLAVAALALVDGVEAQEGTPAASEGDGYLYLPDATFAQYAAARNSLGVLDTPDNEPHDMTFIAYGFPDTSTTSSMFDIVVRHVSRVINDEPDEDDQVRAPVSIGKLGDNRYGALVISDDFFTLWAVVQLGPNILETTAFGGPDTVTITADWLETFLAGATNDPASLIPAVEDLPIGWALLEPGDDILGDVTTYRPPASPSPES